MTSSPDSVSSSTSTLLLTGGGAAGLLFVHHFLQRPELQQTRVILIDEQPKTTNDHTWCFWEPGSGPLDEYVFRQYPKLNIYSEQLRLERHPIAPYVYKMIRGIDFYRQMDRRIEAAPNVERRYGRVASVGADGVVTMEDGEQLRGEQIFNSILFEKPRTEQYNYLDQHFAGWVIRTKTPQFDPDTATFMDFRIEQQDDTRFFYVLPHDAHTALVEIAIFNNKVLEKSAYDAMISEYIDRYIGAEYEIVEREFGIIPMTDAPFPPAGGRVYHFGTAGGDVKPSSGYAFYRIHQHALELVTALAEKRFPQVNKPFGNARHRWMDSVFLNVLEQNRLPAARVFRTLFERNTVPEVFRFLNEETSLWRDLQFMNQMPKLPFTRAALQETFRRFGN